jgi:endonuclease/exonuclease/phosphatase family metal-dependent hydrolase
MTFRIATFNLENLGDAVGDEEALAFRIEALRPHLLRLEADVLCLQEVNAQTEPGHRRSLRALEALLQDTPYAGFNRAATTSSSGGKPRDVQNLVILSRLPILESREYLNDLVDRPSYRLATANPAAEAAPVSWDRPVLYARIGLPDGSPLHIVNLHLRAPLPSFIPGQKQEAFVWKSVEGWAEGTFVAEIKRTGQALEARFVIDRLFDADPKAAIVVLGDFNADGREAPLKILRGDVDETGNGALAGRTLTPIELSLPADRRFSVLHFGQALMLDHIMVSRSMLARFRKADIHNELLTDELVAFFAGRRDADSFHAPVVAEFAVDGG